jgi:hypothetical protein
MDDLQRLEQQERESVVAVEKSETQVTELETKKQREARLLQRSRDEQQTLTPRQTILKHDVELDSIYSVLKFGLVLMIQFVLKEYLGNSPMEPKKFLERIAPLPARLQVMPNYEIVTFADNPRDPEIMNLLRKHCESFNARQLRMRSGRILRIGVDPELPQRRARPRWAKSRD